MKHSVIFAILALLFISCSNELTFEDRYFEKKTTLPCNENCPQITVKIPFAKDVPVVADSINKKIFSVLKGIIYFGEKPYSSTDYKGLLDSFIGSYETVQKDFPEDTFGWEGKIEGRVIYQSDSILNIEINHYTFTGGAHGYQGLRSLIFNPDTGTSIPNDQLFKDKNVKTYDSVNNNTNERDTIIEWFKNTPDAILINTGCFTKGFDVCDVEAIIVARATKSLALWIQICGRGARITNKIKKDNIIIIDGGNNIEEHGTFSFNRNWNKIFNDRKIKLILEPQQECEACGFTFDEKDTECPNCGHVVPIIEIDSEIQKETKQFTINGQKAKLEPPTMDINYFINKGSTDYEALKILAEKWIHFISKSKIEEKDFKYHLRNGNFQKRFDVLLKPQYLQIIRSILKKGKNVIYKNYCNKILSKAYDKKYGTN